MAGDHSQREGDGGSGSPTPPAPGMPGGFTQHHIGVDFITSRVDPGPSYLYDFFPYPVAGPQSNFFRQGGLGGLTEYEIQRRIVMAVEDSFREIDTGNPETTVAIAIHHGKLDQSLPGRRLNMAMAGAPAQELGLLGEAKQDAFGGLFEQDGYAAATYLDRIDQLGDNGQFVVYDTLPEIIYGIAGTAAHEVGHIFGGVHVNTTANTSPQPLMATSGTGLPVFARFAKRSFSTTLPAGSPNAPKILNNAGTVARGDFNMDRIVDGLDLAIMFDNWSQIDRLFHEGDASNDHLVDGLDAAHVYANWSGDTGGSGVSTASAWGTYDPQSGQVVLSSDGVVNWFLQSDSGRLLTGADALDLVPSADQLHLTQNEYRFGLTGSLRQTFNSWDLGPIAPAGIADLRLHYNSGWGSSLQMGTLTIIPEPMSTWPAWMLILGCWYGSWIRREPQATGSLKRIDRNSRSISLFRS